MKGSWSDQRSVIGRMSLLKPPLRQRREHSLRNSDCPERIYDEIREVCPQVVVPRQMQVFDQVLPMAPAPG